MRQNKVDIPQEVFAALEWQDEGLPAICAVNQSLANFKAKPVFAWHLSILVDFEEIMENGMPTSDENLIVGEIGKNFREHLKADGNGLFLARITWNGTRQFLYRISDPGIANSFLVDLIENTEQIRAFEFKMEQDEEWGLADWYLNHK